MTHLPKNIFVAFQFDNLTVYDFDIAGVLKHLRSMFERATVLTPINSKIIDDTISLLGFKSIAPERYPASLGNKEKAFLVNERFYPDSFFSDLKTNDLEFLEYAVLDRLGYIMVGKFEAPVDLSRFDLLVVIGGASDSYNFAYSLIEKAKVLKMSIWGFPLGDVSGRLAPFWQFFCEKVFVEANQKNKAKKMSFFSNEIETYDPQPLHLDFPETQQTQDFVILDVCPIPMPNPQLFKTLDILEKSGLTFDFILHVRDPDNEKLYDILLNKRLRKVKVKFVSLNSYLFDLAASKFVISFGPAYRAIRFLRRTNIKKRLFLVDYHRRFELIDGIDFDDCDVQKINSDRELVEKVSGEKNGVF